MFRALDEESYTSIWPQCVSRFADSPTRSRARLKSIEMADTLYLSLWYPNLRLEALPDKLTAVLGAFAAHGGEQKVYAATVWPVSWSEAPVFQRVYGRMWELLLERSGR